MPTPGDPPKGGIASGTLTVVQDGGASYNSFTKGFTYNSTGYMMCIERGDSSDVLRWTHATSSEASTKKNPLAKMSSTTWNVIHSGTYDSSAKTFSYSGSTYEIRLEEQSGAIYAEAKVVS